MNPHILWFVLMLTTSLLILLLGFAPRKRRDAYWPVEYLNFIQRQSRARVDVELILATPQVVVEGSNMSLLSILRYAPWVRRVHLQTSSQGSTLADADPFLTSFSESVETYRQRLPSRTVLLLQPGHLLTNYIFPWNVSVRDDECGVASQCPLAPCSGLVVYERDEPPRQHLFWYQAPQPPRTPWTQQVGGSSYTQIQRLFQAEIKHKVKPGVVLVITDQLSDIKHYQAQVWSDHHLVYLFMFSAAHDVHTQLSLLHQALILQNYYIPLDNQKTSSAFEQARVGLAKTLPLGASISHVLWRKTSWNALGQALCQEYHAEAGAIPPIETESIMSEENRRLSTFE